MIIRNGIYSTIRARLKCVLFFALITLLTLVLALGVGVWSYCHEMLSELDQSYTSIALVEYMGEDYPNENVSDIYSRTASSQINDSAISALDGVQLWEKKDSSLAYIDGYTRNAEGPFSYHAIIEFTHFTENIYSGKISIQESELPASFFAIDSANQMFRICTPEHDSGFVPLFQMKGDTFVYTDTSGAGEISYKKSELPSDYVAMTSFGFMYVHGEETTTIGFAELDSVIYNYSPISGLYQYTGSIQRGYTCISNEIIYSKDFDAGKGVVVESENIDFTPEKGRLYTLHGKFVVGVNPFTTFVITDFYDGCEIPPYQDTTDSQPDSIFAEYADYYANANNYVTVEASSDVSSLEAFQQNIFTLMEGRFPEKDEEHVCVVSGDIARQLNLALGDTIEVTYFDSEDEDRFDVAESGVCRNLEIVGISTAPEGYVGYIWVSNAEGNFGEAVYGYQLGHAVLANASATESVESIQALCPDGVYVTLFDQGYGAAVQPIEAMLNTAKAVTLASVLGTIATVFLFAYLFIGRQKETVNTLRSLGVSRGKINLWLLSGAILLSVTASLFGAAIGSASLETIIAFAHDVASKIYAIDARYSEAAVGVVREINVFVPPPTWSAWAAAICVMGLGLSFCCVFLRIVRKQISPKRGKLPTRIPKRGTSVYGRGVFRFAMLSISRGGWRSCLVPAVALVLNLFIGILAIVSAGSSAQMDLLYQDTDIAGRIVSTNGRRSTELVISAADVREMYESGMVDEIGISLGWNYWITEEIPSYGGSSLSENSKNTWISNQPKIVATNSLSVVPEFIYSGEPKVEWLEGWDKSFLSDPDICSSLTESMGFFRGGIWLPAEKEQSVVPCIVSSSFLEARSMEIGDEFEVNLRFYVDSVKTDVIRRLLVVGTFVQQGEKSNIYAPLSLWCDESWINGDVDFLDDSRVSIGFQTYEDRDKYFHSMTRFSTCSFSLCSATQLDGFRDYLQGCRFSQVNSTNQNRTTVMLFDRNFAETVRGLGHYISFCELIYPVLFFLVIVLGIITSWLVVFHRQAEFAIMRGLGVSKIRVFFSYFIEQAFLCILGNVGGILILMLFDPSLIWIREILANILCYLCGCAIAIAIVEKAKLMNLLREVE